MFSLSRNNVPTSSDWSYSASIIARSDIDVSKSGCHSFSALILTYLARVSASLYLP